MNKFKKLLSALMILSMSILMISCGKINTNLTANASTENNTSTAVSAEGQLKIHYIDVGQADSILVEQGNEYMLIDAGNNDDEQTLKNYLNNLGITEFKYVVGTHPHEDHIGSLDYIINSFKVGKVYFPKSTSTTKTFENVVNAVKNKGMQFTTPAVGETFNVGQAKCTVLAPNNSTYKDLNNYSIVIKIEFGSNSFLFTGDAEDVSEKEILAKNKSLLKADVLKVGHHGSHSSTTQEFLDAVNPKYAVISCGKDNDYGHPHSETMTKLNAKGIQIYRTDESGTIVAVSDGKNITFNTKSSSSTTNTGTNANTNTSSENNTKNDVQTNTNTDSSQLVWIANSTAKVYHKDKNCSSMKNPTQISLREAGEKGLKACSKCAKE